jgi:hypothetical protein
LLRAVGEQSRGLRLGLDALRGDRQIQAFAEADNGAHEHFAFAAGRKLLEEAPIDLELVEP